MTNAPKFFNPVSNLKDKSVTFAANHSDNTFDQYYQDQELLRNSGARLQNEAASGYNEAVLSYAALKVEQQNIKDPRQREAAKQSFAEKLSIMPAEQQVKEFHKIYEYAQSKNLTGWNLFNDERHHAGDVVRDYSNLLGEIQGKTADMYANREHLYKDERYTGSIAENREVQRDYNNGVGGGVDGKVDRMAYGDLKNTDLTKMEGYRNAYFELLKTEAVASATVTADKSANQNTEKTASVSTSAAHTTITETSNVAPSRSSQPSVAHAASDTAQKPKSNVYNEEYHNTIDATEYEAATIKNSEGVSYDLTAEQVKNANHLLGEAGYQAMLNGDDKQFGLLEKYSKMNINPEMTGGIDYNLGELKTHQREKVAKIAPLKTIETTELKPLTPSVDPVEKIIDERQAAEAANTKATNEALIFMKNSVQFSRRDMKGVDETIAQNYGGDAVAFRKAVLTEINGGAKVEFVRENIEMEKNEKLAHQGKFEQLLRTSGVQEAVASFQKVANSVTNDAKDTNLKTTPIKVQGKPAPAEAEQAIDDILNKYDLLDVDPSQHVTPNGGGGKIGVGLAVGGH